MFSPADKLVPRLKNALKKKYYSRYNGLTENEFLQWREKLFQAFQCVHFRRYVAATIISATLFYEERVRL